MRFILPVASVFAAITGFALAGQGPCPAEAPVCCKPVRMIAVVPVEDSCSGAKDCAGDRGGCHGRSRTTFAQRREARVAGRCAARDARGLAREAAASCHGVQVISAQVVEVAESCPSCEDGKCQK